MGVRGPVPKRTSERLGHLTKADKASATQVTVTGPVKVPPADETWPELVREWYGSLVESGQAKFYEPSDWAAARILANEMAQMLTGAIARDFKSIWSAMADLLSTEAARRRVKMEVNRKPLAAAPAPVAQIDAYRDL